MFENFICNQRSMSIILNVFIFILEGKNVIEKFENNHQLLRYYCKKKKIQMGSFKSI